MDQDPVERLLVKNSKTEAEFHANLEMYAFGTPLEYIFEKIVIRDEEFHIDRRVYIPNGNSSSIIDIIVDLLPQNGVAVDVGTGCGWIGILIKKLRPDVSVILTDLEAGALEVAKKNSNLHGVDVDFVRSHLLEKVDLETNPDLIISNLSFINTNQSDIDEYDDKKVDFLNNSTAYSILPLSIYSDLINNMLQLGFSSNFILEVGAVEDAIVERTLQFNDYTTEIVRKNENGFAILRRQ